MSRSVMSNFEVSHVHSFYKFYVLDYTTMQLQIRGQQTHVVDCQNDETILKIKV